MREGGYSIWTDRENGRVIGEMPTVTCNHCNRVMRYGKSPDGRKVSLDDLGGLCKMCMKPTCGPCTDKGRCVPFEAVLYKTEQTQRLYNKALEEMGLSEKE